MVVRGWIIFGLLFAASLAGGADGTDGTDGKSVAPETGKLEPAENVQTNRAEHPPGNLTGIIDEIIGRLKVSLPEYSSRALKDNEDSIIRAFVQATGLNLKYVGKDYENPPEEQPAKLFPALKLAGGLVVYFRIDGFNGAVFAQLAKDCGTIVRQKRKEQPYGIIVDLRNCRGFDLENARKCLLLFCPAEKIDPVISGGEVERLLRIKLAVLTGKRTSGAAEIFADLTQASVSGIIIGAKTAGQPFKYKKFPLKNGKCLLIPDVPENFKERSMFCGAIPLIAKTDARQTEYDKVGAEPDENLRYAVNMLISLRALGE